MTYEEAKQGLIDYVSQLTAERDQLRERAEQAERASSALELDLSIAQQGCRDALGDAAAYEARAIHAESERDRWQHTAGEYHRQMDLVTIKLRDAERALTEMTKQRDAAWKDCHVCHHNPDVSQACSVCHPSCRGCEIERLKRALATVQEALKGLLDVIDADNLIPESVSYMQQARQALSAAARPPQE